MPITSAFPPSIPVKEGIKEIYKDNPLMLKFAVSIDDILLNDEKMEYLSPYLLTIGGYTYTEGQYFNGSAFVRVSYNDDSIELDISRSKDSSVLKIEPCSYADHFLRYGKRPHNVTYLKHNDEDVLIELSNTYDFEEYKRYTKIKDDFNQEKFKVLIHDCLTTKAENFVDIPLKLQ